MGVEAKLKVVNLPSVNLKDVGQRLHEVADTVQSWGDDQLTAIVVLLREDQSVQVYGYGARSSGLEVQGALARAQFAISKNINNVEDL